MPHPEKVAGFVLTAKEASVLCGLPLLSDIRRQAAAGGILHHQCKVVVRQQGFLGLDHVDVPLTKISLYLHRMAHLRVRLLVQLEVYCRASGIPCTTH